MPYNRAMSHLDILLPFGLPPPELARDLLRELKLPALATLMARAKNRPQRQLFDDFARALPHEMWLASQFSLPAFEPVTPGQDKHNSPALACAAMRAMGLSVEAGAWFMLHPAHIHIARDHLVLTDIRQIGLSDAESRELFDAALPLFAEAGRELVYGDANTWFLRADDWQGLLSSTPDATCGHNIDIWMPKGSGDQAWRKLQNEVQMLWFAHPLNERREMQGRQTVNSLWLWGGATAQPSAPGQREVFNLPDGFAGLGQYAKAAHAGVGISEVIAARPGHGLLTLSQLIQPALTGEWSDWLQQLQTLESTWFAPLLQAMQQRRLDSLSLIVTDSSHTLEMSTTRLSLKKFWLKPALTGLLPSHSTSHLS
ncbi:hypothetical protein CFter6_3864 [Collimonas fungivorans]|uniref:Regulatory protein, RpfE type n=2 Tax=Collimonas fungivorans TaxID=158899 RepID=A0A127PFS4_9BURK|nr:hypothetical protein CFter6_3864 [Collimonas fungivorans]